MDYDSISQAMDGIFPIADFYCIYFLSLFILLDIFSC